MTALPQNQSELLAALDVVDGDLSDSIDLIWQSFQFAQEQHQGQLRESGDPYIVHPFEVARIVVRYIVEPNTIAAAFLHDLVEDERATLDQVRARFGDDVTAMVDGVTKLRDLEDITRQQRDARNLRKLFMAMVSDPRVVVLKLADRLHNLRTLDSLPAERQHKIAEETLDVFAHIAEMFGIWEIKRELEDRSFKYLDPENYERIRAGLRASDAERGDIVNRLIAETREVLAQGGYPVEHFQISGRPKHLYSIYRKLQKPKYRGLGVEAVYDKLGIRIVVETREQCYGVLGLIHGHWPSIPGEFDDYISNRPPSGYQSLHTAIRFGTRPNDVLEFQIRTASMHEVAEHGIAAHWRYKDGYHRTDPTYENKLEWLKKMISSLRDTEPSDFVEKLKNEVFETHIFVFTPKGRVIELPEGSTPVDLAYHIHTEIGHQCVGAKVNSRIVPLDYHLRNSEIVEIMTSKNSRGPSRDWLSFVKTTSARNHIKRFFRRAARDENITAGRDLLEKELKRLGLTVSFEALLEHAGAASTVDDMFALIGSGEITARAIAQRALAQQVEAQAPVDVPPPELLEARPLARQPIGIQVTGVGSVQNRLARCCNPVVGEPIVGYVTRGRGITVHRADCRTILNEPDHNRLIPVSWGAQPQTSSGYSVPIRIEAWDRLGLWRDVSGVIADADVNIEKVVQNKLNRSARALLHVTVTIHSVQQLTKLLDKLNQIPEVVEARRESTVARKKR